MKGKNIERIFWSLLFIVAAVVLVMNQLGFWEGLGEFSVWRLLFAALAFVCGVKSLFSWNAAGVFFSAAFIGIIYAKPLGIEALSLWTLLLAALLLSIGFSMLLKGPRKRYYQKKYGDKYGNFNGAYVNGAYMNGSQGHASDKMGGHDYNASQACKDQEEVVSDTVCASTAFGSSVKYINSGNLKNVNLQCSFGAMKVYFDKAIIQNGIADVWVDVSFAGVELYVPRAWKVVNNVDLSLAGMDEKNRNEAAGDTVLRISGKASFSGITIIYI